MQFLYKKSLTQINDNGKKRAHFKIIQGKNSIVQEIDGISHDGKTFQIKKTVKKLKRSLPGVLHNLPISAENNVSSNNNTNKNTNKNTNNINNTNNTNNINNANNTNNTNNTNNSNNNTKISTRQKLNSLIVIPPHSTNKLYRLNSKDIMKLLEESQIKLKKKSNHREKSEPIKEKKERKVRMPKIIPLKIDTPQIKIPKELRLRKTTDKQPILDTKKIKLQLK